MDKNFIFIVSEYISSDSNIELFCEEYNNEYFYLGQILHPYTKAIGLPEQEDILRSLYGKPSFNFRKSPCQWIGGSPLDDCLDKYLDEIYKVCQDDIRYISFIDPYHCQQSYSLWYNIIKDSEYIINIIYDNLFYLYISNITRNINSYTKYSILPLDLLNFIVYTEGFRTFLQTSCEKNNRKLITIKDSQEYSGLIPIILSKPDLSLIANLDEICSFFYNTLWSRFFPPPEEVAEIKRQTLMSVNIT